MTRVIGLGQPAAGDDGVGLAVVEHLRAEGVPDGVSLETVPEPSALVERLGTPGLVVVVDAVVGSGAPGDVLVLAPADLDDVHRHAVSTHGLTVAQAIDLAGALHPIGARPRVRIVGVVIEPPARGTIGLSAVVAASVPRAAAAVRALLSGSSRAVRSAGRTGSRRGPPREPGRRGDAAGRGPGRTDRRRARRVARPRRAAR